MENYEVVEFEEISRCLDRCLQIENREMVTKGFIPSDIKKSLLIYVHSGDHIPKHFHIKSEQRKFNQKFSIDDMENISKIKDHGFDAYIKKFFKSDNGCLDKIIGEFYRLNPGLRN